MPPLSTYACLYSATTLTSSNESAMNPSEVLVGAKDCIGAGYYVTLSRILHVDFLEDPFRAVRAPASDRGYAAS